MKNLYSYIFAVSRTCTLSSKHTCAIIITTLIQWRYLRLITIIIVKIVMLLQWYHISVVNIVFRTVKSMNECDLFICSFILFIYCIHVYNRQKDLRKLMDKLFEEETVPQRFWYNFFVMYIVVNCLYLFKKIFMN